MPQTVTQFLEAADRAELADLLLESLPQESNSKDPEFTAELYRRVAELDSGEVKSIPWEEVRRQLQIQLETGVNPDG